MRRRRARPRDQMPGESAGLYRFPVSWELLKDDAEYLRMLPFLSLIFLSGRENRFVSGEGTPFYGFVVAEEYEATCAGAAKMLLEGKEREAALLPGAEWFVATLVAEALLSQDGR